MADIKNIFCGKDQKGEHLSVGACRVDGDHYPGWRDMMDQVGVWNLVRQQNDMFGLNYGFVKDHHYCATDAQAAAGKGNMFNGLAIMYDGKEYICGWGSPCSLKE